VTVLCSIGTTHPWNLAGIGLDARVAARLRARHVAVVAGVSAQEGGAWDRAPVAPALIQSQMTAVRAAGIDAIKIGALLATESVDAVVAGLRADDPPIVCDPVIAGSQGHIFADDATIEALRRTLFPRCALVTPNLAEASRLCGFPVNDRATMAGAAHTLVERDGAAAALVTGGHLACDDATDVLYAGGKTIEFSGPRIDGTMRGTGCALATAIAIGLGRKQSLGEAIERGRALVREALEHASEWSGQRVWPW